MGKKTLMVARRSVVVARTRGVLSLNNCADEWATHDGAMVVSRDRGRGRCTEADVDMLC